jgi:hypothetical protein
VITSCRGSDPPDPLTIDGVPNNEEHVAALEKVVLVHFADRPPCRRKHRRPPTPEALAEAERIRRGRSSVAGEQVVLDFARYAAESRPLTSARAHEQTGGEAR